MVWVGGLGGVAGPAGVFGAAMNGIMGTKLKMITVAEGVETVEQLNRIRELGCTKAQGYLFSKPVPATELPALLAQPFARERAA